jgi:hypothetical protein
MKIIVAAALVLFALNYAPVTLRRNLPLQEDLRNKIIENERGGKMFSSVFIQNTDNEPVTAVIRKFGDNLRTLDENQTADLLGILDERFVIYEKEDNISDFTNIAAGYEIQFSSKEKIAGSVYISGNLLAKYSSFYSSFPNYKYELSGSAAEISAVCEKFYRKGADTVVNGGV